MIAQANLLTDSFTFQSPRTEGIKYAGSKLKLLPNILTLADKVKPKTVLDGFSGSTRVSQAFARYGCDVLCNDHAVWSEVFGICYLKGGPRQRYQNLVDHLNAVKPKDGWFTKFYGGDPRKNNEQKRPWQIHNTRKLDGIREEIAGLSLDAIENSVALTSLILALDQVDSTLGHFASYLRDWSPRSYNELRLRVPDIVNTGRAHRVTRADVFDMASTADVDLAYYDPPYGSNNDKMPPSRVRYASYYHLWTTICLNDQPAVTGKANRRADASDTIAGSVFEEFRRNPEGRFIAVESIRKLLASTRAKHVILSYSSGGRATSEELNDAINASGEVIDVIEVDYKRNVMAGMKWTNEWLREAEEPNREFLFLIART